MYSDLERVGIEQGALERVLADQKVRTLRVQCLAIPILWIPMLGPSIGCNNFVQAHLS